MEMLYSSIFCSPLPAGSTSPEQHMLGSLMATLGPSTLLVGLVGVQQVPGQTGASQSANS